MVNSDQEDTFLNLASTPEPGSMVVRIYTDAEPEIQREILKVAIQPLSVLSLVAVANGIFSRVLFKDGQLAADIPIEQVTRLEINDVSSLIEFAYQVSDKAFDGLAPLLLKSRKIAAKGSTLQFLSWISKRTRTRRHTDKCIPALAG